MDEFDRGKSGKIRANYGQFAAGLLLLSLHWPAENRWGKRGTLCSFPRPHSSPNSPGIVVGLGSFTQKKKGKK